MRVSSLGLQTRDPWEADLKLSIFYIGKLLVSWTYFTFLFLLQSLSHINKNMYIGYLYCVHSDPIHQSEDGITHRTPGQGIAIPYHVTGVDKNQRIGFYILLLLYSDRREYLTKM